MLMLFWFTTFCQEKRKTRKAVELKKTAEGKLEAESEK